MERTELIESTNHCLALKDSDFKNKMRKDLFHARLSLKDLSF